MTATQQILTIALCALATMLTRFLPFLLFSGNRNTPKVILYLGRVLPAAVFGMLVVYCLKNVSLTSAPHGLPEAVSILFVALLYFWKRNMLLPIAGGTILYMLLTQLVF